MDRILTVSELTANLKALVETGFGVLWVEGEVSNLRRPGSGHVYFTLKDETSQIRAVMFRGNTAAARDCIEEGRALVCRGRVSVYAPRGDCQIVVDAVELRGAGALQIAFEQLKRRLDEEGLFDARNKRLLPAFPQLVGIVTSPTGAALRDILTVMGRRWPSCNVLVAPARVQGTEAAAEICEAIDRLNRIDPVDLIIVARGGGSLEDMQPFNDERTARAIHRSTKPVVSAVGHEIDYTIADFAADLRAPTPSAAAELVLPDRREMEDVLTGASSRLVAALRSYRRDLLRRVEEARRRIADPTGRIADLRISVDDRVTRAAESIRRSVVLWNHRVAALDRTLKNLSPAVRLRELRRTVRYLRNKAVMTIGYRRGLLRSRMERALAVLDSAHPDAILRRGYSVTRRCSDGSIIRKASLLRIGEAVTVTVAAGSFSADVTDIRGEDRHGGTTI